MLSLETIMKDTIWVGKFYEGGRIKGTYDELSSMQDEFKDFDLICLEGQPEHLREFYEGYFNQRDYYIIQDYYNNVYAKNYNAKMYEVSYVQEGIGHANIYIANTQHEVESHFLVNRPECEFIGIRETTYTKPGQPIINLTRGGIKCN